MVYHVTEVVNLLNNIFHGITTANEYQVISWQVRCRLSKAAQAEVKVGE
jgi:hypothetical protein